MKKTKDFKGTLKRVILQIFKEYTLESILIIIFSILSTIFNIYGPKILGKATTEIFKGIINKITQNGSINFYKIKQILILTLILYIFATIFSFSQGWIMSNVSQKMTYNLRKKISKKINTLPMGYFEQKQVGEILSTITNDVDTFGQSLNQSFSQIITSVITIIGIIIIMFSINIPMTLVTLCIIPLSGILLGSLTKFSQKYFIEQQEFLAQVNADVEESYNNQSVITAFNHIDKNIENFKIKDKNLANVFWKSQFISGLMFPIVNFINNIVYIGIVFLGSILVANASIQIGDIQAFIQYIRNFTHPLGQIAQIMATVQNMIASIERIYEFLDTEDEKIIENPIKIKEMKSNVNFENVKFGYTKDKIIINDFNSNIESGKMIAIVGPTGAGKTTIVKLLMRFYELNGGRILIDGNDISKIDKHDLRKYFTMVLQDTWLFNGTIMENLRYGKLDATDDEVINAAKLAQVHHFIETLPGGYNMILSEDSSNISQGQRQLLTIARALLADKPILILDEATSSVDTRTEIMIQEAMNKLMKGKTTFVIAHRLSTIKNADTILVVKDGNIIEQGNHNELLEKNGFYSELYYSQFNN